MSETKSFQSKLFKEMSATWPNHVVITVHIFI